VIYTVSGHAVQTTLQQTSDAMLIKLTHEISGYKKKMLH